MHFVELGSTVLLVAVFAVSAYSKVRSRLAWQEFRTTVTQLRLLPASWDRAVAFATVAAELATVLALLSGLLFAPAELLGFLVAAGLATVFMVAITVALRRGFTAACRCFGAATMPIGRRHLVRNWLLLAAAAAGAGSVAVGLASGRAGLMLDASSVHPGGAVLATVGGALVAIVLVQLDGIVDLFVVRSTHSRHHLSQPRRPPGS